MVKFIKSVKHTRISDKFIVSYLILISKGKNAGTLQEQKEIYTLKDLPNAVLEWVNNPKFLKEEVINTKDYRTIIGAYPIRKENGVYSYRESSNE